MKIVEGVATDADLWVSRSLIWINEPTKVLIARRGVHEHTEEQADAVKSTRDAAQRDLLDILAGAPVARRQPFDWPSSSPNTLRWPGLATE